MRMRIAVIASLPMIVSHCAPRLCKQAMPQDHNLLECLHMSNRAHTKGQRNTIFGQPFDRGLKERFRPVPDGIAQLHYLCTNKQAGS